MEEGMSEKVETQEGTQTVSSLPEKMIGRVFMQKLRKAKEIDC
jgi:hypothetical protein